MTHQKRWMIWRTAIFDSIPNQAKMIYNFWQTVVLILLVGAGYIFKDVSKIVEIAWLVLCGLCMANFYYLLYKNRLRL